MRILIIQQIASIVWYTRLWQNGQQRHHALNTVNTRRRRLLRLSATTQTKPVCLDLRSLRRLTVVLSTMSLFRYQLTRGAQTTHLHLFPLRKCGVSQQTQGLTSARVSACL